jgi:adenosylcobinamide kinase/adenosylcobinamide-phosphate guanylyltransferase
MLVLGGARSGKSRFAQTYAEASGLERVFIATAEAYDDEMRARIERHRADRDGDWTTVDAPIALAEAILTQSEPDRIVLVDCLTLWVSNLVLAERDLVTATDSLVYAIDAAKGPVVLVSNEVGWGIVPENALARRFRDEAGIVNQRVAAAVNTVRLIVAGLPMPLKG